MKTRYIHLIVYFIFFINLFSCSILYKNQKTSYEKATAMFHSNDPERHRKALDILGTLYPKALIFGDVKIPNIYYERSSKLKEAIRKDYVEVKKKELFIKYSRTRIAYVEGDDYKLYTMNLDGSDKRPLAEKLDFCKSPRWSNDGKYIVFSAIDDIYIIKSDGTGLEKITVKENAADARLRTALYSNFRDPDWSPDGSKVLFSDRMGTIYTFDMKTRKIKAVSETEGDITSAIWLKNSRDILVFGVGELRFIKENAGKSVLFELDVPDNKAVIPDVGNLLAGYRFSHGSLSRDGNKIVSNNGKSFIINFHLKTIMQVYTELNSSWSPEDQYIMDINGSNEIYIIPVDPDQFVEKVVIGFKAKSASWSPWLEE